MQLLAGWPGVWLGEVVGQMLGWWRVEDVSVVHRYYDEYGGVVRGVVGGRFASVGLDADIAEGAGLCHALSVLGTASAGLVAGVEAAGHVLA
jgi:hypothetical protein